MRKIDGLSYSNGKLAFSYDGSNVAILEVETGRLTKIVVELDERMPLSTNVRHDYLAVRNLFEAIVMNWKTGEIIFSTRDSEMLEPKRLLFANDNTVIISGNMEALVYNLTKNDYVDRFPGLSEDMVFTFLESGKILIYGSFAGTVNFFSMNEGKRIRQYKVDDQIYDVAVVEQDNALYTWHGAYVAKWNLETGRFILIFDTKSGGEPDDFWGRVSDGGEILVSTGYSASIHLWDTSTGQLIKTLSGHQPNVSGLAVTEDNILYSCGWDGAIRRWNLETFEGAEVDITGFD